MFISGWNQVPVRVEPSSSTDGTAGNPAFRRRQDIHPAKRFHGYDETCIFATRFHHNLILINRLMYQKFIITQDGVLKFGRVYLHRDLLSQGEECTHGGGLWKIDEGRRAILLYGRSFDFGTPDFACVRRIEWSGIGGQPLPLFFLPHWPAEDLLLPVYATP